MHPREIQSRHRGEGARGTDSCAARSKRSVNLLPEVVVQKSSGVDAAVGRECMFDLRAQAPAPAPAPHLQLKTTASCDFYAVEARVRGWDGKSSWLGWEELVVGMGKERWLNPTPLKPPHLETQTTAP
jgi:hypothetical protein